MKLAQTVIAGICLAAFSGASLVAETWHTSTIKYLYPQADGTFVFTFDIEAPACTNSAASKYHHGIPSQNGMTDEGAKKIYAAALMATDKAVQVDFDDGTSTCFINRLIVLK